MVNSKVLDRKVKMLKAVIRGVPLSSVVHQLASEYDISERGLWNDWSRRDKWLPCLLELERIGDFIELMKVNFREVQTAAWRVYHDARKDNARIGAFRTTLEALGVHRDIIQTKDVIGRLSRLEEIAQKCARLRNARRRYTMINRVTPRL